MGGVAGSLRVGFINIEELKRKVNYKDFSDLLRGKLGRILNL
jgi:hypothetical protein